jgi:predicted RecB family nuclease
VADGREHILLGGYAAKQCPVRVQNDYSPLVPTQRWAPSPEDQARLDAGIAFERNMFEMLIAVHPTACAVARQLSKANAIAATVHAMESGAPLVLGGWLPDDVAGGRTGRPDVLVKVEGGYLPADVKHHSTVKPRNTTSALTSAVASPDKWCEVPGWTAATSHRYEDGMQLAHYTRMLQACGHHPGPEMLRGAVLGTSQVAVTPADSAGLAFVWHDLGEPLVETFSRSQGKARRSILVRHDHEHAFRVKVAENACRIAGSDDDPRPLVEPIGQDECGRCPYQQWCAQQIGSQDPSAAITIGRLGTREWLTLRRMGVTTTAALSVVEPDDPAFFSEYIAEVSHLTPQTTRNRLAAAIERAEMICRGVDLKRNGDGPVEVPVGDVEIDIDIEYDLDNRVYMWGARVRQGTDDSSAQYITDFTDWEPLDDQGERALAARFAAWLRAQRTAADAAGATLRVFHWSHPEWSKLHSILGTTEVGDLTDPDTGVFVDVEKVFKANFTSLHGSSIKKVGPLFGFTWRVDDPGGAVSQTYLSKVHTSTDPQQVAAAKEWLLSYNEDDNAAMAAIRDGMRAWNSSH